MTGARDSESPARHQAAIVAVLAFAGLCSSFMFTLVVPIQAQLPQLLDASREDTAWVVTATLLAGAITNPIAGRLGDMYGKRRIVLVLFSIMIAGSLIAALSQGIIGAIVGRALQGALVGVVPLGIAIMRDVLHPRHLPSAIALMSATLGVGGAVGMPLSAVIAQSSDWHLLFWIAGGLGALGFVLVRAAVPASTLRTGGRFDGIGAIGLSVGLLCLLLALSRGNEWGWTSPLTLGAGAVGLVVLVAWGWYELRRTDPLLDLRVAVRPPVLLTNLASVAFGFALFGSQVAYPQLLELPAATGVGFGLSLLAASLVVMPSGIVMMVLSPLSGWLSRTVGPRLLLVAGALSLTVAYGYSLLFAEEVWQLVVANILIGFGIGFGFAAMPMLIMRAVPVHETGASNGLNALSRSIGTSVAAAAVGAVLASMTTTFEGVALPTAAAFQTAFGFGIAAAIVALVLAFLIPRGRPAEA
jgi:MFS family permease